MKTTPDDFQDVLAGRQNKPDAVKQIKEDLAVSGLIVKTTRRKLAAGTKIYFTISPPPTISGTKEWYGRVGSVRNFSVDIIQKHFPEASVTSGGPSGWTISEY